MCGLKLSFPLPSSWNQDQIELVNVLHNVHILGWSGSYFHIVHLAVMFLTQEPVVKQKTDTMHLPVVPFTKKPSLRTLCMVYFPYSFIQMCLKLSLGGHAFHFDDAML